jgi:ubiquitin-protein ligase
MLKTYKYDEIENIDFIQKAVKRRIKNECRLMTNNCDYFKVEYNLNGGNIYVTFFSNNYEYLFEVSQNYPFTIPKLFINGIHHTDFFNLKTERFRKIIKYVANIDCLCCNSYLCYNNWAPSVTFKHIIDQINDYKTIKYLIVYKIMLDKIKEKYLIPDINLDIWLLIPNYH